MQLVLSALLAACAELSITAQPVQPTDRAVAVHAINTEPVPPAKVLVSDFEVLPSSVIEEREPVICTASPVCPGKAPLRNPG